MPQRIKPWHALVAAILVGGAIALFLQFRNSAPEATGPFADPERNVIYESGLASCVESAQAELSRADTEISDDSIRAYCACAVGEVVTQLTDAEIALFNETGAMTPESTARMETIAEACAKQFLLN